MNSADYFSEIVVKLEESGFIVGNDAVIEGDEYCNLTDPIKEYMRDVGRINLLSAGEEKFLSKRVHEGDLNAKNILVERNLMLVIKVAKRYVNLGLPLMDLIQEGNIGLMIAAERFDYTKGFRFSTYAMWWIRQAISRSVKNHGRIIRLPIHAGDKLIEISKFVKDYEFEYGEEPSEEEICSYVKIDKKVYRQLMFSSNDVISLDTPVGGEDSNSVFGDFVEDGEKYGSEEIALNNCLREDLLDSMSILSDKERCILTLRYGLDENGYPRTLDECGKILGVTRERVRQIESKGKEKIRNSKKGKKLKNYLVS